MKEKLSLMIIKNRKKRIRVKKLWRFKRKKKTYRKKKWLKKRQKKLKIEKYNKSMDSKSHNSNKKK